MISLMRKRDFTVHVGEPRKTKCRCGEVIRGLISPTECSLFGKACQPNESHRPMYGFCRRKLCRILSIHEGEFLMDKYISLAHGDGGELSHRLIEMYLLRHLVTEKLRCLMLQKLR